MELKGNCNISLLEVTSSGVVVCDPQKVVSCRNVQLEVQLFPD